MKKLSVLFVSILLCLCSYSVVKGQGNTPFMTREFTVSSIKEVVSTTSGGSITVAGDAGSNAKVEVFISRDNWSKEKIKQVLDENYTIEIKVESGMLYAVAKQKKNISNWNTQGLSISFKISVPKQVNNNLQTSGGSIKISNLSGTQNFKTSGGSLTIENVSGNTIGATSGGSINVTGSKDNIDLKTSGGSITAKDCSGKIILKTSGGSLNLSKLNGNINASTSGGSVKLDDITGNISASTSGGSVTVNDVTGTLITSTSGGSMRLSGISGNVEAKTSGGSMDVKIKSTSDYVKLSNSGNINLSLPAGKGYNLKVKSNNKIDLLGLKDFSGKVEERNIDGTVGKGGAEINVQSSQRVRLSFE